MTTATASTPTTTTPTTTTPTTTTGTTSRRSQSRLPRRRRVATGLAVVLGVAAPLSSVGIAHGERILDCNDSCVVALADSDADGYSDLLEALTQSNPVEPRVVPDTRFVETSLLDGFLVRVQFGDARFVTVTRGVPGDLASSIGSDGFITISSTSAMVNPATGQPIVANNTTGVDVNASHSRNRSLDLPTVPAAMTIPADAESDTPDVQGKRDPGWYGQDDGESDADTTPSTEPGTPASDGESDADTTPSTEPGTPASDAEEPEGDSDIAAKQKDLNNYCDKTCEEDKKSTWQTVKDEVNKFIENGKCGIGYVDCVTPKTEKPKQSPKPAPYYTNPDGDTAGSATPTGTPRDPRAPYVNPVPDGGSSAPQTINPADPNQPIVNPNPEAGDGPGAEITPGQGPETDAPITNFGPPKP